MIVEPSNLRTPKLEAERRVFEGRPALPVDAVKMLASGLLLLAR